MLGMVQTISGPVCPQSKVEQRISVHRTTVSTTGLDGLDDLPNRESQQNTITLYNWLNVPETQLERGGALSEPGCHGDWQHKWDGWQKLKLWQSSRFNCTWVQEPKEPSHAFHLESLSHVFPSHSSELPPQGRTWYSRIKSIFLFPSRSTSTPNLEQLPIVGPQLGQRELTSTFSPNKLLLQKWKYWNLGLPVTLSFPCF